MKIKVAILEQDQNYQNRLLVALREKFSDKLEIFPCNTKEDIAGEVEAHQIKVFAVNQMIDADLKVIPEECATIILTEMRTADKIKDCDTVCKYQKVHDIGMQLYKIGKNHDRLLAIKKEKERRELKERLERERKEEEERLRREKELEEERKRLEAERLERERKEEEERLAAQRAREEEERKRQEEERRAREEKIRARRANPALYVFLPVESGEGSSLASIACTISNLSKDYNILYRDFTQYSKMGRFFLQNATGNEYAEILTKAYRDELTAEDVLKGISIDVRTRIEYINNNNCMYEIGILGAEGFDNFMKAIGSTEKYDIVIMNMESMLSPMTYAALKRASKFTFVGSGLADSNNQLKKKVDAIRKFDEANHTHKINHVNILYNKFDRKCTELNLEKVKVAGVIPVIKEKTDTRMLDAMVKQPVFKEIIDKPED